MGIMNDLLFVRPVTMSAIAHLLAVVLELNALRMTNRATDARVGRGFIFFEAKEREPSGGWFPARHPHPVAMETDPLQPFGIIHGCGAVAGHARLILRRKRGQDAFALMANPALAVSRNGRIESSRFLLYRDLGMRIVAGEAVSVFPRVLYLLGPVEIARKLLLHIVMARKTMIGGEKLRTLLDDVARIRMSALLHGLPMAVPAGVPSVNRDMENLRIDEPCALGFQVRRRKNEKSQCDDQKKSTRSFSGKEGILPHTEHLPFSLDDRAISKFHNRNPRFPANKNEEFYVNFSGRSTERSRPASGGS
ncbi:MAG: hypothetical protein C4576_36180 [Desulfobacteraceae bacterium]|nr:MAG: hypothetical protein C4576_36180 [Desulfobacteraceae bacterium]